jgi:hypothetical protein
MAHEWREQRVPPRGSLVLTWGSTRNGLVGTLDGVVLLFTADWSLNRWG